MQRTMQSPKSFRRGPIISWALFNWAHDTFPVLITSFVFASYFTESVAINKSIGAMQWGWASAIAGIITAIISPFLGALADQTGQRMRPFAIFSLLNAISCAILALIAPNYHYAIWALILYATASFSYEAPLVYYNAMLKSLVPKRLIGRVSGWGWASGYFGGIAALLVAIYLFISPNYISHENAYNIRVVPLFCSFWFIAFGWPIFIYIKNKNIKKLKKGSSLLSLTFNNVKIAFTAAHNYPIVRRFIIARLFYIDALNTTFLFAGIFASSVFHMTLINVLYFGLSANVSAGIGTVVLSFIDDWLGPRFIIFWSIVVMLITDVIIFFTYSVDVFWIAALCLSFFSGIIQSSSRSYLTHLAPPSQVNQMFGLYALAGRSTSFIGPILSSIFILELHKVRNIIPVLFALGLIGLLIFIRLPHTHKSKHIFTH